MKLFIQRMGIHKGITTSDFFNISSPVFVLNKSDSEVKDINVSRYIKDVKILIKIT